jgi:hypothetical protein
VSSCPCYQPRWQVIGSAGISTKSMRASKTFCSFVFLTRAFILLKRGPLIPVEIQDSARKKFVISFCDFQLLCILHLKQYLNHLRSSKMANQDFYNGGNTGQQFPQPDYSSYQQPQYNSGGQQGGSYGGQPIGTYGGQPVGTYGGQGQQYQAQYGTALRQDQSVSIYSLHLQKTRFHNEHCTSLRPTVKLHLMDSPFLQFSLLTCYSPPIQATTRLKLNNLVILPNSQCRRSRILQRREVHKGMIRTQPESMDPRQVKESGV